VLGPALVFAVKSVIGVGRTLLSQVSSCPEWSGGVPGSYVSYCSSIHHLDKGRSKDGRFRPVVLSRWRPCMAEWMGPVVNVVHNNRLFDSVLLHMR